MSIYYFLDVYTIPDELQAVANKILLVVKHYHHYPLTADEQLLVLGNYVHIAPLSTGASFMAKRQK